ncbi:MAG: magnesium transporter MgtE [Herpetosiphonaceae bacterium]|nr:MAG: magnesium transporter MgtE [Herpetosiphonaceae bacterium]
MTKTINLRAIRAEVGEWLEAGEVSQAVQLIASLHPADGAEVLSEFQPELVQLILRHLDPEYGASLLAELDRQDQVTVVSLMEPEILSDILDEMAPDDAADLLGELEPEQVAAALETMEEADEVRELLSYDKESAGGLMSPHIVTLRDSLTSRQAIDFLRRVKPEEDTVYYLFVVDGNDRLVGVVSLRQLVIADPRTILSDIMKRDVIAATVDTDQEECARLLARYDLLALPIVDRENRIVGAVTADDIIDVIEEEATEDIYRLANLDVEENVEDSLFSSARRRLFWLLVNLPTAILAGWVVSRFQDTVDRLAILASFMPIVAGMGGNAGIQTLTLIVRSIALGEVEPGEGLRALSREMTIGAFNGLVVGGAIALLGVVWQSNPMLGLIAGAAMLLNLIAAAVAGTVVPLTLKLFRVDPALASGVIVTTVTDVTGYTCLLGLATLLLSALERAGP